MVDHRYEVLSSRLVHKGRVTALRTDSVLMPGGEPSQRDVVELPGAVAIVALDDRDRVLLVRQYRHPVRRHLWEVPAGLLDTTTETPQAAGERELFEEGYLRADRWDTLIDLLTSPGMTDETIRVLLARGLTEVPEEERFVGFHEEADMERDWVPLAECVDRAFAGELENGITVAAVLAAAVSPRRDTGGLRAASSPWRARKQSQA